MKRGMDVSNRENRCNISCEICTMGSQVDGMVNSRLAEHYLCRGGFLIRPKRNDN